MANRYRKMHPYHPRRRRSSSLKLQKQQLHDWEHRLNSDVGALIVLVKSGNQMQIEQARGKAKSSFLKWGPEMQALANTMGGSFATAVREYLNSLDLIIHSEPGWIDEEKIRLCYTMTEKLEKQLLAA